MRRHIKFVARNSPKYHDKIEVVITEQTHKGNYFTRGGSAYILRGFWLESAARPEPQIRGCYMRGSNPQRDLDIMLMGGAYYQKFKEAVEAYNAEYTD